MKFLGVNLLTTTEFLKAIGWTLSRKMFEYLRDTLHLIPRPIRVGTGNGTVAYYPEFAVSYLKQILKEKKKGSTFNQIKIKFNDETLKILDKSESLKRQFELEKRYRNQAITNLKAGSHPDFVFKNSKGDIVGIEVKVKEIKKGIKDVFKEWDGETMQPIIYARELFDELEMLEAIKRVTKSTVEFVRK